MFLFLSLSLSLSAFDWSFCVYFCMFPVCPRCCFIVISVDPVSEINDVDDDDRRSFLWGYRGNTNEFLLLIKQKTEEDRERASAP